MSIRRALGFSARVAVTTGRQLRKEVSYAFRGDEGIRGASHIRPETFHLRQRPDGAPQYDEEGHINYG